MEDNQKLPVFFSFNKNTSLPYKEGRYIVIFFRTSSWNDFGYETHSEYCIFDGSKELNRDFVYLSFLDDEGRYMMTVPDNASLIEKNEDMVPAQELPLFISMQKDMQSYRYLVGNMTVREAKLILRSMNDMVYLRSVDRQAKAFSMGAKSLVFHQSFIRSGESFFAYHNAGSILEGVGSESFDSTSSGAKVKFSLPGFENDHELKFNFKGNKLFSNRVCVLIGKNGTGKSRALYSIASAAISGDHKNLTDDSGNRLKINRVVAVSTPGETENTYPKYKNNSNTPYFKISLRRSGLSDNAGGMGEAVVRLARSGESIRGESRWNIFRKLVKEIAPEHQIALKISDIESEVDGSKDFVTIDKIAFSNGEQRWLDLLGRIEKGSGFYHFIDGQAYPFSSGQITFLRFVCQLCLYVENGALILLDEPETHLHPNLVVSFYSLLDKLLDDTGSIAIIATHSPYFVREVTSSQVVFLREEARGIIVSGPPRLRTLAADISAISFFIFGDDNRSIVANKIKNKISNDNLSPSEIKSIMGDELSSEMISFLSRQLDIETEDLIR